LSANWLRRDRRRTEQGYAAILVAAMMAAVFLPLAALSVDAARLYVEAQRLQNAADAASMAGVTFMPDDLDAAAVTAKAVAKRNGYDDASSSVTVAVTPGAKPTQLKVTISSVVYNSFAASFGSAWATVSRSSVADYNGPAPMGSPCNAFGNEPPPGAAEVQSPGSQIVPPTGGASCTSTPQFWGAIAGPETNKSSGDAIMTRKCNTSGTSGCSGTTNDQFNPMGYFYLLRVGPAAVGTDVTIQIYDPAFVENGDTCEVGPNANSSYPWLDNMNPFTHDGLSRYVKTPSGGKPNAFCTGDVLGGSEAPVTSFALRAPTDTYRPASAAPVAGIDGSQCARQYKGYKVATVTSKELRYNNGSNASYVEERARVYHQWVNMCTFRPTVAGDYYLQVRTNVKIPAGAIADGNGGYRNNPRVYTQTGDDTSVLGNGNNRFALRVTGGSRGSVSISGWEQMGIYANFPAAVTEFNLVRVIPAAASKSLTISFFDVGDATQAGTIQVLPPVDSNLPTPLTGCTGAGVINGALTDCKLTNVSTASGWNGKAQTIRVPIPNGYTCQSTQPGGCWFRLQVSFPGGVTDTTTWFARVQGDPVRLIE
jgi:Flp pilus assembly protein TadG